MNHLIVGKGLHKIFSKLIHGTKGQLVVLVLTVNWIGRKVAEHIMHPPHIPLKIETEPTSVGWVGDLRERGRFLRYTDNI